jgi:hypothetical protein
MSLNSVMIKTAGDSMKIHTTNYQNAFIGVASDCAAEASKVPPNKAGAPSVAELQYALIAEHPYELTSDEIMFQVHVQRLGLSAKEVAAKRDELWIQLFEKGMACMRASPLTKTYGWGLHFDDAGRVALVAQGSKEYKHLSASKQLKLLAAMRNKRA